MARIGALGDSRDTVVFTVSHDCVRTFANFRYSSTSRYAVHNRHLLAALPEYTGRELDRVTFDLTLSAYLGTNPREELAVLQTLQRQGRSLFLQFGRSQISGARWVIQSLNRRYEQFDNLGRVLSATVSVTLLEYPER